MGHRKTRSEQLGWFVPFALLIGVGFGVWITRQEPRGLLAPILGLGLGLPIVWIVISALWPGKADRLCPRCGSNELARLDPRSTYGLRCGACDYQDDEASGWLLAEEEGALEEIVLSQRRQARGRIRMRKRAVLVEGEKAEVDRRVGSN
jgi:ribosomal protein S27AE